MGRSSKIADTRDATPPTTAPHRGEESPAAAKIDEIHAALMGNMEKPGWISRLANVERVIRVILCAAGAAGLGFGAYIWTMIIHAK